MSLFGLSKVLYWLVSTFFSSFDIIYRRVMPKAKHHMPSHDVCTVLRKADAICFDVDSTVINDEGIVRLAESCGVKAEVEKITNSAMSGGMSFKEALKVRLNIIKPSRDKVEELRQKYIDDIENILTPGIRELVTLLQSRRASVYLISGGFIQLIEPVADAIGIPIDNIYSNILQFTEQGEYNGFDENQVTCDSGGKGLAVQAIKQIHKRAVMIGDGMTDYEASPPADLFIGFGGNVERQTVKDVAPWYIHDFQEIIHVLNQ